ncbi:hypothetical protein V6N13_034018 [Hibiscus sabdariffa]
MATVEDVTEVPTEGVHVVLDRVRQHERDKKMKNLSGATEGVAMISLVQGHDVSSVLHRIVTRKGLGAGVHKAIWIDGHIGKGQGSFGSNGSKIWGEEFGVKDGSTPVDIQDADDMSWMEHSSEDEDRVFSLSRDYVHGHAMWHDIGYEGDQ